MHTYIIRIIPILMIAGSIQSSLANNVRIFNKSKEDIEVWVEYKEKTPSGRSEWMHFSLSPGEHAQPSDLRKYDSMLPEKFWQDERFFIHLAGLYFPTEGGVDTYIKIFSMESYSKDPKGRIVYNPDIKKDLKIIYKGKGAYKVSLLD